MSRWQWVGRLGAASTAAAIGLVASGAVLSPASADAPTKVGWWNAASGGGQSAPAPDASTGGIRVAVSSSQVTSFGAVELPLPKDGSGTLTLAITHMTGSSSQVLNDIQACPTKDDSWKSGDDQPVASAPAYDCSSRHFVGSLDSTGASMSFSVDGSADTTDGILSLAIVPVQTTDLPEVGTDPGTGTDLTPPFVIDFDKPGSSSFSSDSSSSSGSSSTLAGPPSTPSDTGNGSATTTAAGGPAVPAGASTAQVDVPPAPAADTGQTPVVAGQQQTTAPAGTYQAAATKPLGTSENRRDLLLVMLILLLFGILYTQNAAVRPPRALVRRGAPAHPAAAADAAAVALPVPYPTGAPRGLGRFAKQRNGPARPLI